MQPIPDPQRTPLQLVTGCVSQTTTALLVLVAQMAKHAPAVQETWVQSLGQEDHLETEWLSPPVFLAGEFHGLRSLAGNSLWGHRDLNTTE